MKIRANCLIIASAICAFSAGVNANILSDQIIKRELIESATSSNAANANEHLYARMISSKAAAKAMFSVWSNYDDQSVIGERWGEVGLNLLRWSDPERVNDWNNSRRISGVKQIVYQQDGLVNLERVQYLHGGYPTTQVSGYTIASIENPARAIPKTSERLLSEGMAPVGPDNKPVSVCRLGPSSQAPYVELSESQKISYSKNTGMSFSSCLSGSIASAYWKARYGDFVDKYHDRRALNISSDLH